MADFLEGRAGPGRAANSISMVGGVVELTDVAFWDDYWKSCVLPAVIDPKLSFDRCLGEGLKDILGDAHGASLEIGCAPGRWMAFFNREFGLLPSGIEYSKRGAAITADNCQMQNVPCGKVIDGDFFAITPVPEYDVVASFGFIEHFTNVHDVISRHIGWLKPGGTLVLGVPNFRGIYGWMQRHLDNDILTAHNTEIMTLDFFRGLSSLHPLKLNSVQYLGSFEPFLPILNKGPSGPLQLALRTAVRLGIVVRRAHAFDRWNHPSISSYILSSFVKTA